MNRNAFLTRRTTDPGRSGEYLLHPRLKIANNTTGASVRRHPRLAGPSHLKDVVIPALPPEDSCLAAVGRAMMRYNELLLASLISQAFSLECAVQVVRVFSLPDLERYLAALAVLESWKMDHFVDYPGQMPEMITRCIEL